MFTCDSCGNSWFDGDESTCTCWKKPDWYNSYILFKGLV